VHVLAIYPWLLSPYLFLTGLSKAIVVDLCLIFPYFVFEVMEKQGLEHPVQRRVGKEEAVSPVLIVEVMDSSYRHLQQQLMLSVSSPFAGALALVSFQ
jgi:hypothetical protein